MLSEMFQIKLLYLGCESNSTMLTLGGVDAIGKRLTDVVCLYPTKESFFIIYRNLLMNHQYMINLVLVFTFYPSSIRD